MLALCQLKDGTGIAIKCKRGQFSHEDIYLERRGVENISTMDSISSKLGILQGYGMLESTHGMTLCIYISKINIK